MLNESKAYSGFAVPDLEAARTFYGETLGMSVRTLMDDVLIQIGSDERPVLVYQKDDHKPANYTILNFPVADVDAAVDELAGRGVEFERYDGFNQDEKGIARPEEPGPGPTIAWFTDPAGNILAVHEELPPEAMSPAG
jgi:catechol 2,3-dioxygenase-like lactoylglutathione lyase family enzyme